MAGMNSVLIEPPTGAPEPADFELIAGMMEVFAKSGSALAALDWGLPRLLASIGAEAGALFTPAARPGYLACTVCAGPVDIAGMEVAVDSSLVGAVFGDGQIRRSLMARPHLHHAARAGSSPASARPPDRPPARPLDQHDPQIDRHTGMITRSALSVPVGQGDQPSGVLQAINKSGADTAEFSAADASRLAALAGVLGLAMANLELAKKAIQDQLLARDLEQAEQIQRLMLPSVHKSDRLAGMMLPARQLAGDFFSWHSRSADICFCLGDVSGKGISAALLAARLVSLFDFLSGQLACPVMLARQLNRAFCRQNQSGHFASLICGRLDQRTGETALVNCGHLPVLLLDPAGGRQDLPASTLPLGIAEGAEFSPHAQRFLLKSSCLFAFTDGVTEARLASKGQPELGSDRLAGWLAAGLHLPAADQAAALKARLEAGGITRHDDASLLVVTGRRP